MEIESSQEAQYRALLDEARRLNDTGRYEEALQAAEKAYELFRDSFPRNYSALMQKKRGLEGLRRGAEAEAVGRLIKELVMKDQMLRATAEARDKNIVTDRKKNLP